MSCTDQLLRPSDVEVCIPVEKVEESQQQRLDPSTLLRNAHEHFIKSLCGHVRVTRALIRTIDRLLLVQPNYRTAFDLRPTVLTAIEVKQKGTERSKDPNF